MAPVFRSNRHINAPQMKPAPPFTCTQLTVWGNRQAISSIDFQEDSGECCSPILPDSAVVIPRRQGPLNLIRWA